MVQDTGVTEVSGAQKQKKHKSRKGEHEASGKHESMEDQRKSGGRRKAKLSNLLTATHVRLSQEPVQASVSQSSLPVLGSSSVKVSTEGT